MTTSIRYYDTPTNVYVIDTLVTGVTWFGDIAQAGRNVQVSLKNTVDGQTSAIKLDNGKKIDLLEDGKEIFRGVIFLNSMNSDGTLTFTAYDSNHYLNKNKVSKKFIEQKASQIIQSLCKEAKIEMGKIDDTGYIIPKMILRDMTIYDMITTALTETKKKTGKLFLLGNTQGKLTLLEQRNRITQLVIGDGVNIINASYSESIEELRNSVRVVGEDNESEEFFDFENIGTENSEDDEAIETSITVSNAASIKKYGLMRETVTESGKNETELKSLAEQLLENLNKVDDEFNIEALGNINVYAGKTVEVKEKMTGISGLFYVITDTHTLNPNGVHTMKLTLSRTLDVRELEYVEPKEEEEESFSFDFENGGSGSGGAIDGYKYENFEATAYNPSLGGINGSGDYSTTASGTKFTVRRTVAIDPKVIPYGSVLSVIVEGDMAKYSGIWLAEDTGGAIDQKRIDMGTEANEAMQFGRRQVKVAVLERGSGRADARSKANDWASIKKKWEAKQNQTGGGSTTTSFSRANIVQSARSYVGKLIYVFGGKLIDNGSGDCSGFTYHVYKKRMNLDIGHGTSSQIAKGKRVSKSEAQPGDLVFFQGTYRPGVSHVGIVTDPSKGLCISLASSGCKEHSYVSGYWGDHYMEIRSVL